MQKGENFKIPTQDSHNLLSQLLHSTFQKERGEEREQNPQGT